MYYTNNSKIVKYNNFFYYILVMPILKTIHINPELLSISSNKTRKNKKKKERLMKKSKIIQPNTLKKALLRRIKEKSQQEKDKKTKTKTRPYMI